MRRKGELLLLKSACLLLLDSLADLHANIHHTGCFQYLVEDQERLDSCIDQLRKWIPQGNVGRFSTLQQWSWENHQQHQVTKATERFWSNRTVPPRILYGLSQLDTNNGTRIRTWAENIEAHQFQTRIEMWGPTNLYGAAVSWLQVKVDDPDLQCGHCGNFPENHSNNPVRTVPAMRFSVTFSRPYAENPLVIVWLTGLDLHEQQRWCVEARADDVAPNGFTLSIESSNGGDLRLGSASWLAWPRSKDDTWMSYLVGQKGRMEGKVASFYGKFASTPQAVMGLHYLDFDPRKNLRVDTKITDVTTEGCKWDIFSWADTEDLDWTAQTTMIAVPVDEWR